RVGARAEAETGVVAGAGAAGAGVGVGAESEWEVLLSLGHHWHKTVYTLQIIDSLLQPAPMLRSMPWARDADMFKAGFLRGGGFARALKVAMVAPVDRGDTATFLGHAAALRILKTCLFPWK
ncbi:unnamed protein product, partial [Discosporangium mesarthrocarpum]